MLFSFEGWCYPRWTRIAQQWYRSIGRIKTQDPNNPCCSVKQHLWTFTLLLFVFFGDNVGNTTPYIRGFIIWDTFCMVSILTFAYILTCSSKVHVSKYFASGGWGDDSINNIYIYAVFFINTKLTKLPLWKTLEDLFPRTFWVWAVAQHDWTPKNRHNMLSIESAKVKHVVPWAWAVKLGIGARKKDVGLLVRRLVQPIRWWFALTRSTRRLNNM